MILCNSVSRNSGALQPDGPNQGMREPEYHAGDDLQAGDERREALAQDSRVRTSCQGHRGCEVQRWSRSEQRDRRQQERRLTMPYTRFDHSSQKPVGKNGVDWPVTA